MELSDAERGLWSPARSIRAALPVLLYRGVTRDDFARQMALLDHAGWETVELAAFVRFVAGEEVALPPRPLLLTFDGGRLDSWRMGDAILRELDFNAVMFVDVGCVEAKNPKCLRWDELERMQDGGRWDVQLQSGTAGREIRYGPEPNEVGPFYAYRGSEERIDGWRERVFSDITYGEEQLAHHVDGYRPLAFAPPSGNYGKRAQTTRASRASYLPGSSSASKSCSPRTAAASHAPARPIRSDGLRSPATSQTNSFTSCSHPPLASASRRPRDGA